MGLPPNIKIRRCFTLYCLDRKLKDFYPTIKNYTWNYHESGHGKGAPGGIEATCKRTGDRIVAERKDLADFETLVKELQANCRKVIIIPIKKDQFEFFLGEVQKCNATTFCGTQKVHQIVGDVTQSILSLRNLARTQRKYIERERMFMNLVARNRSILLHSHPNEREKSCQGQRQAL